MVKRYLLRILGFFVVYIILFLSSGYLGNYFYHISSLNLLHKAFSAVHLILLMPPLILAWPFDQAICWNFFNTPLEGIKYTTCNFYESPVFPYLFAISVVLLIVIFERIVIIKKNHGRKNLAN